MAVYPVLASEIAKRGIKKKAIARQIGICDKSLYAKINGKVPFTWPEVCAIQHMFFPDIPPDVLFAETDDGGDSM